MSEHNARASGLEPEVVIRFVRSNPKPIVFAVSLAGDRAVVPANVYGLDAVFLLESERRMLWIGFE
jgi:hypothetical protein